jgi:hypothetical protein
MEVSCHIHGLIGVEGNAFVKQELLHEVRMSEMMFARECAETIDNTMCWHVCPNALAQRVADHSRRKCCAKCFCNFAVSGNLALWNLTNQRIDLRVKIFLFLLRFRHALTYATLSCLSSPSRSISASNLAFVEGEASTIGKR